MRFIVIAIELQHYTTIMLLWLLLDSLPFVMVMGGVVSFTNPEQNRHVLRYYSLL